MRTLSLIAQTLGFVLSGIVIVAGAIILPTDPITSVEQAIRTIPFLYGAGLMSIGALGLVGFNLAIFDTLNH